MKHSISPGEVWWAAVPYKENAENSKHRPVVVVATSPTGRREDVVVLVVPITGFHGGAQPKRGDVSLDWRTIGGLTGESWVRARRVWAADPAALDRNKGCVGKLSRDEMSRVYTEVLGLFES